MVIDDPTTPRKHSAGLGRLTGGIKDAARDSVRLRRLRLAIRRLWVHTIRRVPTREETVLRQIHERAVERHEMTEWTPAAWRR